MRRIKIVLSDFHLGHGRNNADGTMNDLEDFVSDRAFIDLLEYYRTGEYFDTEVELILNGDIFECLGALDPDDPEPDWITPAKSVAKITNSLDGHKEFFEAVRGFASSEHRQVTFMVGNHDQDLLWKEVHSLLKERIHPSVRVLNGPYRFDGVHLEHGFQYEPQNRIDTKRMVLSEGVEEPILKLPWGSDMFINCLLKIKRLRPYVNRVRPFRLALFWSVFHDFRAVLNGVWAFFAAVFKARFRRHKERRISLLQTLRVIFHFDAYPTLDKAARKILESDAIHTVIFGHTHVPMSRNLLPGKTYLNSGSWIPNTSLHIASLGRSLMQTYIYLEYDDDVPRGRLKVWYGQRVPEEDIVL
ncbi:MAG: hypothetical protein V1754_08895 [Pseudomonadota bacterium]